MAPLRRVLMFITHVQTSGLAAHAHLTATTLHGMLVSSPSSVRDPRNYNRRRSGVGGMEERS